MTELLRKIREADEAVARAIETVREAVALCGQTPIQVHLCDAYANLEDASLDLGGAWHAAGGGNDNGTAD